RSGTRSRRSSPTYGVPNADREPLQLYELAITMNTTLLNSGRYRSRFRISRPTMEIDFNSQVQENPTPERIKLLCAMPNRVSDFTFARFPKPFAADQAKVRL